MQLNRAATYPVLAEMFIFTCTITNAAIFSDEVQFFFNHAVVGALEQKNEQCKVLNKTITKNYQLMCSEGTDQNISDTKTYALTVNQVLLDDLGYWRCQTRIWPFYSNIVALELKRKFINISM